MSTLTLPALVPLQVPFPGLRSFEAEEALLFYGREAHVEELLDRLGDSRFVAVVGTSGSGKSSLVRAGLRPALQRGYLVDATSRWRFATMRPGAAPLDALATALAGVLDGMSRYEIARSLETTSAGLSEVVLGAGLSKGESLLIIADQFEELFRFDVTRAQQGNVELFVSQLLEATERHDTSIYVVVTMRSEFLGRCSEFTGLAEAFNRSQYLVPRLSRDERRQAIERPLRLFATEPSPALVQQVLNDAGDDPDQLPVLQHALLRTYQAWLNAGATGRIDREHYDAIGRIESSLDAHGEELFAQFDPAGQSVTQRLFRSLTVTQGGVALRRPRSIGDLYRIAGATSESARQKVNAVVGRFADRQNAFLVLSGPALEAGTVVDITHESVIRKWTRLRGWVREESRSAEWYTDLSRDVARYRDRSVSLWRDPELAGVLQRQRQDGWNQAWADQYRSAGDPEFPEVTAFLEESERVQDERSRREEEQRNNELRQAQNLARTQRRQSVILALLLLAIGAAVFIQYLRNRDSRQMTDRYEQLLNENRDIVNRRAASEAELARLKSNPAASLPENQAKIDQLTKAISDANSQAQASQQELAKMRKDQDLNASDKGRLLTQIGEKDRQLVQIGLQLEDARRKAADATAEAARLRTENASPRQTPPVSAAPAVSASAQDVTKAFAEGVSNYDFKNWYPSAQLMRSVINGMRTGSKELPKDVRMQGTRFIPLSPQSYLAAALFELKADCTEIVAALRQAKNETVPPDLPGKLASARSKCGS